MILTSNNSYFGSWRPKKVLLIHKQAGTSHFRVSSPFKVQTYCKLLGLVLFVTLLGYLLSISKPVLSQGLLCLERLSSFKSDIIGFYLTPVQSKSVPWIHDYLEKKFSFCCLRTINYHYKAHFTVHIISKFYVISNSLSRLAFLRESDRS